jgi:hypothetical protein
MPNLMVDTDTRMRRARRLGTACAVALMCMTAPFVATMAHAADTTDTTTTSVVTDSTYVYDLVNEPSQCIGFLPKPDCGKKPQQAGDRGGALQWATFGVIIAGVGVIATVLVRNVIRRDRAIAEDLRNRGL